MPYRDEQQGSNGTGGNDGVSESCEEIGGHAAGKRGRLETSVQRCTCKSLNASQGCCCGPFLIGHVVRVLPEDERLLAARIIEVRFKSVLSGCISPRDAERCIRLAFDGDG